MKNNIIIFGFWLLLHLFPLHAEARILQNTPVADTSIEMADQLRADGKIYIVVAIIVLIFAGIVFYLVLLEKKINRLEKEIKPREEQLQN
jgi:hypothetical protein